MPEHRAQKDYWESIGRRRSPDHPAVRAFSQPKLRLVRETLGPGLVSILEVGAGNGYLTTGLLDLFDVTVVDFSSRMLALNPTPTEKKVQADAASLPFGDALFDVVLCANLLHHLPDPAVAVREMARVAKHNLVLIEPNALNPAMFLFGMLKKEERGVLRFTRSFLRGLGDGNLLELRHFATHGIIAPNRTPTMIVSLLRPFDVPQPLGLYNIAIFDVR